MELKLQDHIVVVTGAKYEKKIGEETASIDVIETDVLENTNSTNLAEAVVKSPGVNLMDGQASIRQGSGYAYGAGSRVQVLVDGQPLLTGDLSEVRWTFIPIENAEQIEVIKGASSVLYGSSALNGIIHVRTGYAKNEPETKLILYQGIYSNPRNINYRWWDDYTLPFFTGGSVVHRHRFGRFDMAVAGNVRSERSYLQGGDRQHVRLNFKSRHRPKKIERLTYGLNFNQMYEQWGRFFLWRDADSGAYIPLGGYNTEGTTLSKEKYTLTTLDPHVTYVDGKNNRFSLNGRYYNVVRIRQDSTNSVTNLLQGEFQYQRLLRKNYTITTGISGTHSFSRHNIYNMVNHTTANGAFYVQAEKTFWQDLTLLGGFRYEVNAIDTMVEPSIPVFRAGLNYTLGERATYLRASFGQGYRFPSVAERYIDDNIDQINIFPNPGLDPEIAWNAELGIKQGVKLGQWLSYLDFAAFWSEYENMTEFAFGLFLPEDSTLTLINLPDYLGFRTENVGNARIAGFEVSIVGKGALGPVWLGVFGGYTYTYPVDINQDPSQRDVGTYLENFFNSFDGNDASTLKGLSRYRNQHVVRFDAELSWRKWNVGANVTYNSFMEKVDSIFVGEGEWGDFVKAYLGRDPIPGIEEFRSGHDNGDFVLGARIGFQVDERSKVSLVGKNLTNREYTFRPAKLEAPRSVTFQYKFEF